MYLLNLESWLFDIKRELPLGKYGIDFGCLEKAGVVSVSSITLLLFWESLTFACVPDLWEV